jgi:hypothetical protein
MRALCKLAVLACVASGIAGYAVKPASAAIVVRYYSGTMTENYHNFGRCFYSIASECTGWNYHVLNRENMYWSSGGDNFIGFDNGSSIRGFTFWLPGDIEIYPYQVGWDGGYLRASVALWTTTWADFNYADGCYGGPVYDCQYYEGPSPAQTFRRF